MVAMLLTLLTGENRSPDAHEADCPAMKTECKRLPSPPRQANQWDSGDSDTESLAQERVYQQQLQKCIGHHDQNKRIQTQKENAANLQQGDGEHGHANDDYLQVYDSLEVAVNPHDMRELTSHNGYLDTQTNEREGSLLLSDDDYSDLRYDPNWRTKLKETGRFTDSSQNSVDEYFQVPVKNSSQSYGNIKGGYRLIVDTNPTVMQTSHMTRIDSQQPYCLHPQESQTSSESSTPYKHHTSHCRSPEADLSRSPRIFIKDESGNTSQREYEQMSANSCRSAMLTKEILATDFQPHNHQEPRCTQRGRPIQETSTLTSPKVNKKPGTLMEDIVERNKITLGRTTSKHGSYVKVHSLKQEMPHTVIEVHETVQKTATVANPEDSSDPELRWLQKTRQLRVTQLNKGKKAQRKEYPGPRRQQVAPALAVRAKQRECLSSPLALQAAVAQPRPHDTTPPQPLPPTIQFNINLNASSHLLSLLHQKGQDAIINLTSLHGHPHWSPTSEQQLAFHRRCQQKNPGKFSLLSQDGLKTQLPQQILEGSPEQWQRPTLQWPLSCEGEDQTWSSNEVHTKQLPQNLTRTPTTASSQGQGSYTVLPPIGKPTAGKGHKMSPGQSMSTVNPVAGSSSDSYLVQMEKLKQLKARGTNKGYNQMKTDTGVRGLHPDYTAVENTDAEKMKRQKLYSNVIREQNKKISRIPFLPAKDPGGSDKKVPRVKALEYAKSIAKPPVPSQPKQRQKQRSESFTEHTPYLPDLDVAQLTRLEHLRKRHEEEKQAVSLLRKVHAV
ncbi:hypothetical protein INR49_011385 [Caranx melampygus]|nr:hypothetical protein INR49_011385 [Caranx melampygus]